MEYVKAKDMYTYSGQTNLRLPKGQPAGTGHILYVLGDNERSTRNLLDSNFVQLKESGYKHYYIDHLFKSRIGVTTINENKIGELSDIYDTVVDGVTRVKPTGLMRTIGNKSNIVIDLSYWMKLWYEHRFAKSSKVVCEQFTAYVIQHITRLIGDPDGMEEIIYVPITRINKVSFKPEELTSPLAIILCGMYKYPETIAPLQRFEFLLVDEANKEFIRIPGSKLVKDNYNALLTQLKRMDAMKNIPEIVDDTEVEIKPTAGEPEIPVDKNKKAIAKKVKDDINKELLRNVSASDITDDEETPNLLSDDEETEIEDVIAKVLGDSNENESGAEVAAKASLSAKQRIFISKFQPDRTKSQVKKIEELAAKQFNVTSNQSSDVLKSKIIEPLEIDDAVEAINTGILKSNFAKLDKSYNEQKLATDLTNAVTKLSHTDYPVFVTDITEKDTSDPMTLKKTLTYHLEDMNGRKMSFKVDIPIIIDDSYIYVNGGKKVIGHQHMLRPIVKSGDDEVQLVTFYGKSFMKRKGESDVLTNKLKKYIISNEDKFKVKFGNMYLRNKGLPSTLEIDTFAKNIGEFTVGNYVFVLNFHKIDEVLTKLNVSRQGFDDSTHLLIGYNKKTKEALYIDSQESFTKYVIDKLTEEDLAKIAKIKSKGNLIYTTVKILNKVFPLIYLMLYCEGFTNVMEKAKIDYKVIPLDSAVEYDGNEWGTIKCADANILWKRYPMRNTLLMNGFIKLDVSQYTIEELDSKDTYIDMVTLFAEHTNTAFNLDQWKNFVLDDVTKEILADFNYPTDLIEVLAYCNSLLTTNTFLDINNEENLRIRSNEVIAEILYENVAEAYNVYRKSLHHKDKKDIVIKRDCVLKTLTAGLETVDEASDLNPILEMEKKRSVTYKGSTGINIERAISLKRRMYDPSMVGICGITSSNDGKVGINRQLTMNPNITSTRGYLQVTPMDEVGNLDAARLLTASEMLTPMTVTHDDAQRTAMTFKQSQYMLPVKKSHPVLIGNKSESVVPYHTGSTFSKVAKDNGTVVEVKNGVYVIKYDDGTYDSFDTNESVVRNASQGFFLTSKMNTHLKLGDKVKKNEVMVYHDKFFKKNENDLSASMTLGTLAKIAIMPQTDQYEDSTPITRKLSDELASEIVVEKKASLPSHATIRNIRAIGEQIKTGEPLCVFDMSSGDKDVDAWLSGYSSALQEEILEATASTIKSKYSGEIVDIRVVTTVPVEELSPSLQEVVKAYHKRINSKHKLLDKYTNPGDSKYYKCGQLMTESTEVVKPNQQGKVKGEYVEDGVVIMFYIKFVDRMKKGDKLSQYSALKGVVSRVIEEGDEQYSEFRPKEEISTTLAPGAVLARKTPSVFLAMFGNKVMIEQKRKLKSIYFETPYEEPY